MLTFLHLKIFPNGPDLSNLPPRTWYQLRKTCDAILHYSTLLLVQYCIVPYLGMIELFITFLTPFFCYATSCPGIKSVLSLQLRNCSPHWCGNPGTKRPRQYEGVGDVCHSRCDTPPHLKQHNSPTPGNIYSAYYTFILTYILTQYQHPFWQCCNRSV